MDKKDQVKVINGIALAYVGDAAYEIEVRRHLVNSGIVRPNQLQKKGTTFVSAKAQAALITLMQEEHVLTEEELEVYLRGRNAKSYTHAKNTSISTYRMSTGFEAMFGFLSLSEQEDRLHELAQWCIEKVEQGALNGYKFE